MTKPVINLPGKDESDADDNTGSPHVQPSSIYEQKVSSVKEGLVWETRTEALLYSLLETLFFQFVSSGK